jgi:hypothetical protein
METFDTAICDIKSTQVISLKNIIPISTFKESCTLTTSYLINDLKNMSSISKLEQGNSIFTIRGCQVMIDRDLADLYRVEVKRINEQVKRNIERFPEYFRFQLTEIETNELVANCDRFRRLKHSNQNPFVYTEQGVAMLSAVLNSETEIIEFI